MEQRLRRTLRAEASRRAVVHGLGAASAGALALLGSSRPAVAHGTEDVARQAIDAVNQALATGDTSGLDAVFAAGLQGHPPHTSLATGEPFTHDLDGLKAALQEMRHFFPDSRFLIDDLIVQGDKAAGRVTFRATPDPTAFGLPEAAAQSVEVGGVIFAGIAEDRVVEFWAYFDQTELMALIGMATPAAIGGEPTARAVEIDGAGSYFDVIPADLAAMLPGKTFPLINVHVPYEGEIAGTDLFIPFDQIGQRLDELPDDSAVRIVLYCRSGRMSVTAAETLVRLGYTNIWNLAGGMIAWEQAGYPLAHRPR
ncbi:MAG: ester cyclase [Thermomicrobiales bacterium]|nr:ester cyclase [Thermomicrobiales bacterium]